MHIVHACYLSLYMYVYIYIYISISVYIYIYICIYIRDIVSTIKSERTVLRRNQQKPQETKINGFGHILLFPFVK